MSRVTSILVRFIQEIDPVNCSINSIRIKSNYRGAVSGVEFFFSKIAEGAWPNIISLLHEAGFKVDDLIGYNQQSAQQISFESLTKLEKDLGASDEIYFFLAAESAVHPSVLIDELRKKTIYGFPVNLFSQYRILDLQFYFGASSLPTKISTDIFLAESIRSKDGLPYVFQKNESGKIEFNFLTPSRVFKKQLIPIDRYLSFDISQRVNRFKHSLKNGFTFYCFFPESEFSVEVPLTNWTTLTDLVKISAETSLNSMLKSQVQAIEDRIASTSKRKRVFFKGEELGLLPKNEQETVILFERFLAKNNYQFGGDARLKLLDYSPQGIDSVCSFSASLNEPMTAVAVEFEFLLKNFFDHGHDPQQVKLILCYSMKSVSFPYDHFGVIFDLDRTWKLPRLVNTATNNSCYVFALEDVLEER